MSRHRLLLIVWAFLVFGLLVRATASALVGEEADDSIVVRPLRFDVNKATVTELELLPGIGLVRARAIVLDRLRRGEFTSPGELTRVDGLGEATVRALLPYLGCGDRENGRPGDDR